MHPAIEVRAPHLRNTAAMQFWFAAWNEDNRRAREAYYAIRAEQELCRRKLHQMTREGTTPEGKCRECIRSQRRLREFAKRKGISLTDVDPSQINRQLAEAEVDQVVHRYLETRQSVRQIGKLFGVSHTTVRRSLLRRDVKLRSRSTAQVYAIQQYRRNKQPGDELSA